MSTLPAGAEIRRNRVHRMGANTFRRWLLDEVYVKINGGMHDHWRAVDHEGEVLDFFVTKTRDKAAALKPLGGPRPPGAGRPIEE